MVDTVSITIHEGNFKILDHNKFSPNTENLFSPPYIKVTGRSPFKAINNPSKSDKDKYGYLPRITLIKALRKGGFQLFLKVEFSVPKLLYGNNFDEVRESDFGEVCWQIKAKLELMGVRINDVNKLGYADVSSIHYGKNIVFTDYDTPHNYLKELVKINVSRLRDTNQSDYRNEGHAVKYRSNYFEVVMYDKLADLRQAKISEKRAIENDNYIQMNLFNDVKPKTPFEVLRIEVRLGSRKKIQQLLNKNKLKYKELNLIILFSKRISQTILIATVDEIEDAYPKILKTTYPTFDGFVTEMKLNNPELNYSQLLKYVGAKVLIEELGIRGFRKFTQKFGDRRWYQLNKGMKRLVLGTKNDVFLIIREQLQVFEQVELEKHEVYM